MKFVPLVAAALLLAAPALQASAAALPSKVQTIVLTPGKTNAISFKNTFTGAHAGDTFTDRYNFSIDSLGDVSVTVTSIRASAATDLVITGYSLYNALTNTEVVGGKRIYTGVTELWTLSSDDLIKGNYYFQVTGSVVLSGGSYGGSGSIAVAALPVPEPAMPMMLLGGLGLLACVARRKTN